jgi:hypothetical protein
MGEGSLLGRPLSSHFEPNIRCNCFAPGLQTWSKLVWLLVYLFTSQLKNGGFIAHSRILSTTTWWWFCDVFVFIKTRSLIVDCRKPQHFSRGFVTCLHWYSSCGVYRWEGLYATTSLITLRKAAWTTCMTGQGDDLVSFPSTLHALF